jgi:hypothetical protein
MQIMSKTTLTTSTGYASPQKPLITPDFLDSANFERDCRSPNNVLLSPPVPAMALQPLGFRALGCFFEVGE